jgi:hypothetical protein
MFCIVFHVLNVIFIGISLKSFVNLYVFFSNVAHFTFWCCGSMFSFCSYVVECFLIRFMLYKFIVL